MREAGHACCRCLYACNLGSWGEPRRWPGITALNPRIGGGGRRGRSVDRPAAAPSEPEEG
jgi:hypothetical protein